MPTSLLQTKLYAPRARPLLVPRPRLIEKLNQGIHHKLTLISAPAGFGKTTLVSEWIAAEEWPTAWLSLDESDTDPIHFLTYFVAALQRIAPEVGQTILAGLQSPQPPPAFRSRRRGNSSTCPCSRDWEWQCPQNIHRPSRPTPRPARAARHRRERRR